MVDWREHVKRILNNESDLDGLRLLFGAEHVSTGIPPMIKASVSLLDMMQEKQGIYNVLVFPEKVQTIFIFTLAKLLHNIFVGKIKRDYDPRKFQHGERLRLGKAVVEFVEVEERDNLVCLKFRTAESMTVSTPINLLPFFQKTSTNKKLSKYKQFYEEKQAAEARYAKTTSAEQTLAVLADYKTHMESSIFYMTSVINTKELLRNSSLCGRKISDVILLGQADYTGAIRNLGTGQLAGKPAIVLASDLYTINAAIESGCPAQSVIIDVSHSGNIDTQADQIDELIRKGIPITCVTDTVNSFELETLRMRGFNVWRWDESSITPELYETPHLTSDKKNRNCAERKVKYIHIDGLASSEAMKALAARREDSQNQSAQIMKMYEELYSLAFLALRETTPFTLGDLARADQVLCSAAVTIEKEKLYISEEMYNNYCFIIQTLRTVFTDQYVPVKQKALADYLQKLKGPMASVCLIVPEQFEKTHVKQYWEKWCAEAGRAISITVLSPGEYYPLSNATFSSVIIVGWLKRAIMRKILFSFNSDNYCVLLYDYEKRWKNYDVRKWQRDLNKSGNKEVVKKSFSSDKLDISVTRFTEETETVEPEAVATDELNEIEHVLRENKFKQYVARGGAKPALETVEAIPVNYVGGFIAFYRTGHKIISATKIITEDADKVEMILPAKLKVGDFVVVREADHDLIREMADNLLRKDGKLHLREMAGKWREALDIEKLFSTPEDICQRLSAAGCTREIATVNRWLFDEDLIAPQQKQDLKYIAEITGSSVLAELLDQVADAANEVKAAHSQAGRILTENLRKRVVTALEEYGDIDPFNIWEPIEMTVDGIGTVRILKIIDIGSAIVVDSSDTNRLIAE